MDWPSSFSRRMVRPTSGTISGASPSDGSSSSSTLGLPISPRPIPSMCCSPPGGVAEPRKQLEDALDLPRIFGTAHALLRDREVFPHRERWKDAASLRHQAN